VRPTGTCSAWPPGAGVPEADRKADEPASGAGIMSTSTGDFPGWIFMSYRREDSDYPAAWLYERLASHFSGNQVFKDVDSIELGDDFVEVVTTAVGRCDVLLALIGKRWLTVSEENGRRRLDDPDDFVRVEIEAALARNVRVIPVLVEGARMPRAEELPASLAKLTRRHALELSPSRFDFESQRLLSVLDRMIIERQERAREEADREAKTPQSSYSHDYPYASDYQLALQAPARAFTHAGFQQARFALDSWGLPQALAGSSAVVFHATIGTGSYALRCYTRNEVSSAGRYEALNRYVSSHQLTDYVADVEWHEDAVRVKGETWPVLQMEWIDGRVLDQYVADLVGTHDSFALARLAAQWRELVRTLQDAQFAHGSLQHGDVIVDERSRMRLVDFDSVWIPPLRGQQPPTKTGHANYQHPDRSAATRWGPWMDTFPGLVIYLSLTALAKDPGLWPRHYVGDNLLFCSQDFHAPFDTDAWRDLDRLADPEVSSLADMLQYCCSPRWKATRSLESTIEGGIPVR
jgi:hypothetical protein